VPYALPAVCLDISSAEAQLGQVHATLSVTFDARKTCSLTDLSRPEGSQIYRLDSYIHIRIRIHIYSVCISVCTDMRRSPDTDYAYETPTAYKRANGPETTDGAATHDAGTHATLSVMI